MSGLDGEQLLSGQALSEQIDGLGGATMPSAGTKEPSDEFFGLDSPVLPALERPPGLETPPRLDEALLPSELLR